MYFRGPPLNVLARLLGRSEPTQPAVLYAKVQKPVSSASVTRRLKASVRKSEPCSANSAAAATGRRDAILPDRAEMGVVT